jgi:poly(3-hydroxybutyrate) depolymerase
MPYGAAQNFFAAIAAMKDGNALGLRLPSKTIPLMAFHGDQDIMVSSRNSEQLISQWLGGPAPGPSQDSSSKASEGNGRAFTCTVYRDGAGHTLAENWLVHDAGHAWSGGGSAGSFADRLGPDASREMVRFFSEVSQGAARTERGGLLQRLKERLRIVGDSKAV